jgi:hypothetical protein
VRPATLPAQPQLLDKETFRKQTSFSLTNAGSLTAGGDYKNQDEQKAPFAWSTGALGQMKEGENRVKFTMHAWCYSPTSSGGQLVASAELIVKASKTGLTAVAKRPKFLLAPSTFSAASLAAYRSKLVQSYASSDVLDMRSQSQWEIHRNGLGVILDRSLQSIAVLRKKDAPWGCSLVSFLIVQTHDGQKFGPAFSLVQPMTRPFACNVK